MTQSHATTARPSHSSAIRMVELCYPYEPALTLLRWRVFFRSVEHEFSSEQARALALEVCRQESHLSFDPDAWLCQWLGRWSPPTTGAG